MTGELFINGTDAFTAYGLELGEQGITPLLCPPANKEYIKNESRTANGTEYITGAANTRTAETSVAIGAHLTAPDMATFYSRLQNLYTQVFSKGAFTLKVKDLPSVTFHLVYSGFRQFTQFNGHLAVFTLTAIEPDPTNRA